MMIGRHGFIGKSPKNWVSCLYPQALCLPRLGMMDDVWATPTGGGHFQVDLRGSYSAGAPATPLHPSGQRRPS